MLNIQCSEIIGTKKLILFLLTICFVFQGLAFCQSRSGLLEDSSVVTTPVAAIDHRTDGYEIEHAKMNMTHPNESPVPTANVSKTPVATPTVQKTPSASEPQVNAIPNPVRGKKMTFRIMAGGPVKVRIKIYNRFFDPIETLEQEGDKFFDILWKFKDLDEGIYYYQAQVEDTSTGKFYKLHLQRFVVLKDEENPGQSP